MRMVNISVEYVMFVLKQKYSSKIQHKLYQEEITAYFTSEKIHFNKNPLYQQNYYELTNILVSKKINIFDLLIVFYLLF